MLVHAATVLQGECPRARISSPASAATSSSSSARRGARRALLGRSPTASSARCASRSPTRPRVPLRRQRRHRRRERHRGRPPSGCSSTPTSRSTGPRAAAATATSSSPRRCRRRSSTPSASPTRSCSGLERERIRRRTTSRSSMPDARRRRASRRWRAGSIRRAASLAARRLPRDGRGAQRRLDDRPHDPRAGARRTSRAGERWASTCRASRSTSPSRRLHDEQLIEGLRELDIAPGTVSFELVEVDLSSTRSTTSSRWNIDQIKDLGIDIEIDDFGTGYASIVSLLKLQPRRLKIDRQLVAADRQLAGAAPARRLDHRDRQVARHRGRGRGRRDRWSMPDILRDLGCDILQGYRLRPGDGRRRARTFHASGELAPGVVACFPLSRALMELVAVCLDALGRPGPSCRIIQNRTLNKVVTALMPEQNKRCHLCRVTGNAPPILEKLRNCEGGFILSIRRVGYHEDEKKYRP